MFYARIRFDIVDKTYINFDVKKQLLFSKDECDCVLVGSGERINSSDELWIEYGGFAARDEAIENSIPLIDELKLYCSKRRIALKISGESGETDSIKVSACTGGITEKGKEAFGLPAKTEYEALGLAIYEVEKSLDEIPFFSTSMSPSLLIGGFDLSNSNFRSFDDKARIAISLLNSSNALSIDSRVSFLLKVMAVEALASGDENYGDVVVKKLAELQKNKGIITLIGEALKDTNIDIKDVLGRLKKKSIGVKARELVYRFCADRIYHGEPAQAFWAKCYSIRSGFVHFGQVNIGDIRKMEPDLHKLVIDVVNAYVDQFAATE